MGVKVILALMHHTRKLQNIYIYIYIHRILEIPANGSE
jgi:hypothetical protein